MTIFLNLLADKDKAGNLLANCNALRAGADDARVFQVTPESFRVLPGSSFAYWVSQAVRQKFEVFAPFSRSAFAGKGPDTGDDFRFLRLNWETQRSSSWLDHPKGGKFSCYYSDVHLLINWESNGRSIALNGNMRNPTYMGRAGLTWPRRTTSSLGFRAMPKGCIFGDKGPAAFVGKDDTEELLALLAIANSRAFGLLVSLQLAAADAAARSYEVGVIQKTPVPAINVEQQKLAALARHAWSFKRILDTTEETSHAFILPAALRDRVGDCTPAMAEAGLVRIQMEIDEIAFDLYAFTEVDRSLAIQSPKIENSAITPNQDEDETLEAPADNQSALLSWSVGVAFGRFDWRLATGERQVPPEPGPFDPLPVKSPGMSPDGVKSFHAHAGILVDEQGHPHDLSRLIEEVLAQVKIAVPDDARSWLQRNFFAFHLQRYSKSRRRAPIYWPLSTASSSYTLWVYYPALNNQTLFTAVNDFLDGQNGKLTQVSRECAELRIKGGGRSRDEEKQYETLQTFEQELTDLRDTLLTIAPTYQPNHDDGVQITAAPLWQLFRHKPWQKVLKDTWTKLEKGGYDWAHLAMAYWPDRVREKCRNDKSLAIAHGLEDLYVEPEAAPKKTRGKKKVGGEE